MSISLAPCLFAAPGFGVGDCAKTALERDAVEKRSRKTRYFAMRKTFRRSLLKFMLPLVRHFQPNPSVRTPVHMTRGLIPLSYTLNDDLPLSGAHVGGGLWRLLAMIRLRASFFPST